MQIEFTPEAKKEFDYWLKLGDKGILKRIGLLIESIQKDPYMGIGKPEPLRHNLSGKWSRRITQEHRMIYKVDKNTITLYSLKGHYE